MKYLDSNTLKNPFDFWFIFYFIWRLWGVRKMWGDQEQLVSVTIPVTVSVVPIVVAVVTDFFVIQLKSSEVLSSLTELPLLHTFSDKPKV